MTEAELLHRHPELYAAVLEVGVTQGRAAERKRVLAHLKLAEATDAMELALAGIESGSSILDESVLAEYRGAVERANIRAMVAALLAPIRRNEGRHAE